MNTIGIVANLQKDNAVLVADKIIRFLQRHKIKVFLEKPLAKSMKKPQLGAALAKMAQEADLVVALGGDGTFLRAARLLYRYRKPIVGVNLGDLGFLAEVKLASLERDLKLLVKGKYQVSYRMTLQSEVLREKQKKKVEIQPALNDLVISKVALSRIINLETYIDDEYVTTYRADGIIVATPTGSTAYNLSAGGPIVYPGAEVILVAPICPHTLTHRPLVVPAACKVKIRLGVPAEKVVLTVDGQVGLDLQPGDWVVVSKGVQEIPLITFGDTSYFEVLRQKLRWGSR